MKEGYIKLHRSLLESGLWNCGEPFTIREAFIYLLLNVNFKDIKKLHNGRWQVVKRGQIVTSLDRLSVDWLRNRKTVKRYLDLLVEDKMIKVESNKSGTKITVINYLKFQGLDDETSKMDNSMDNGMDDSMDNSMDTQEERKERVRKNKKDKKEKNIYIHPLGEFENVNLTADEFEKLKTSYPKSYEKYIESLSGYLASNNKRYKSHYAVIRNWMRKDGVNEEVEEDYAKKYGITVF